MNTELTLSMLMTIRLKGRMDADAVASVTGDPVDTTTEALDAAARSGVVLGANGRYRITPEGRELLARWVEEERTSFDGARLDVLYGTFDEYNSVLKQIVTDWQLRSDGIPNDHGDATYDAAVVERLVALDEAFLPWLDTLGGVVPRLARYADRFRAAINAVRAGDHSYVAKPITDSYHTVWFELHEELIQLTGRDRVAEAAAGRAD